MHTTLVRVFSYVKRKHADAYNHCIGRKFEHGRMINDYDIIVYTFKDVYFYCYQEIY